MVTPQSLKLSVVICTHNPRHDYLKRTLQSLKSQTLSKENFELIIIDNDSTIPISESVDLGWHPSSRCLIEKKPGVIMARKRGILESKGELIVFVDDDNELSSNYLELCLAISSEFPKIGIFGGQVLAEFEKPPAKELKGYLGMLAIRSFDRDNWSNHRFDRTNPVGAGMCVTRAAANVWIEATKERDKHYQIGSKGRNMLRGEDDDMCFAARAKGIGVGEFTKLRLTHLISKERVTEEYITKLCEGMVFSGIVVGFFWGSTPIPPPLTFRKRIGIFRQQLSMSRLERLMSNAKLKAEQLARDWFNELRQQP